MEGIDTTKKANHLGKVKSGKQIGNSVLQEDSLIFGGKYIIAASNPAPKNVKELEIDQELSIRLHGKISESG